MHFVTECINKTIKNLNICHKQIQEEKIEESYVWLAAIVFLLN